MNELAQYVRFAASTRIVSRLKVSVWIAMFHARFLLRSASFALAVCCVPSIAYAAQPVKPPAEGIAFFERKIRPVLIKHCHQCHSAKAGKPKGGLLLDTIAGIQRGGDNGTLFSAKSKSAPKTSLLYQAVSYSGDFVDMPPKGKLPARVIADFRRWIEMGAPMPRATKTGGPVPQKSIDIAAGRAFWSFQPVRIQQRPDVADQTWPITGIDSFILKQLEQRRLKPSKPADRRTWIRRVTLDLIGLPPTAVEIREFLADRSPEAYHNVVNRLLASPHYGERWGRHWLDIARYAEDNPTSESTCKPPRYPHPYRDWVIRALNEDMPYDQFVRRQLAADLIPGLPPGEIAATGFLGLSPVYHKEPKLSRDVILNIVADEWDERIDTISRGLLGLTIACARCHDHKFDPIKREDYYSLAGVMASTQLVEWPLEKTDAATAAAVTDTRLAIVDLQLRVSYAKAMVNTAKEQGKPTARFEKQRKRLQKQLDAMKARKLYSGKLVNGVRDAGMWIDGSDPAWTELDFRPGVPRNIPIFIRGSVTSRIDQIHPSLGAWTSYGLGTANRNLPMFVSLKKGMTASRYVRNGYLPGEFQGTPIDAAGETPEQMVLNLRNPTVSRRQQQRQLEFIRTLNRGHRERAGADAALDARIRAMETAFRMQFAAGEALDVNTERKAVREEYGEGWFANACLLSRRLVERGVRYIHVEHSRWDDHDRISKLIPKHCQEAELVQDCGMHAFDMHAIFDSP
eukprot:g21940.t1